MRRRYWFAAALIVYLAWIATLAGAFTGGLQTLAGWVPLISVPVVALPLPIVALVGFLTNRRWAAYYVHATTLVAVTSWLWLLAEARPLLFPTTMETLLSLTPGAVGIILLALFSLAAHRWARHANAA
jgi:hypothetical protein